MPRKASAPTSHLTAELFESLTGTKLVHLPYKAPRPR